MDSYRSKEEDVMKISTSTFVSNLPDRFGAKDLWNTCQAYGHVIDTYIPNRRSKAGKRFGFVRFIKVHEVDRLVNSLCTVWVGRNKLHANVARFQRDTKANQRHVDNNYGRQSDNNVRGKNGDRNNGTPSSFAQVVRGEQCQMESQTNIPSMVLDESCLNKEEISLRIMGKVKEFASLNNLKVVLAKEGYANINLKYMGGFWVMIVFQDEESMNNFHSSIAIGSWFSQIVVAHHDFIVEERVVWIEVEGVPWKWWSRNTFNRIASRWGTLLNGDDLEEGGEDNIQNDMESEGTVEEVPETCFEDGIPNQTVNDNVGSQSKVHSEDPFGIYAVLNKKKDQCNNDNNGEGSPKYPPGFTPSVEDGGSSAPVNDVEGNKSDNDHVNRKNLEQHVNTRNGDQGDSNESNCSGHFKKSAAPRTGGSILHLMDELVKVGQTMGFNMSGCVKNMEEIIESQGVIDGFR
ncbi:nucleotide-binding alpha-beta plait domain-containing protein [Tanacetum coccineum]